AWRFCYWASNTKFPLVTTGEREHICNDDFLTRKWEPDWRACNLTSGADFPFPSHNINTGTLEDQHLSAEDGLGTWEPPEDQHSNVTIICQYCRAVIVIYLSLFFFSFLCVCVSMAHEEIQIRLSFLVILVYMQTAA
ncbi:unnamed protein product, partial [Brassica rapa subsp. trilocularis]